MANLPRSYTKVVRGVTGRWGAYPLSQDLAPGMVGRKINGVFVREAWLKDLPGYDPATMSASLAQKKVTQDAWVDRRIHVERLGVGAGGGALPADAHLRLSFTSAHQGAVACRGLSEWAFDNLRLVKQHLLSLFQSRDWDPRDILVTSVLSADAAWVFVSSDREQFVDVSLSGMPAPSGAREVLKAVIGSATLDLAHAFMSSGGYFSNFSDGGTPLFQAVQLKRYPRTRVQYLRGPEQAFTEPIFGAEDDE